MSNFLAGALQTTPLCYQAGTGEFGQPQLAGRCRLLPAQLPSRSRMTLLLGLYAEQQSRKNIFVRETYGLDLALNRSVAGGSRWRTSDSAPS